MNYQKFKDYRDKLQSHYFRLDDTNPYPLAPYFFNVSSKYSVDIEDGYYVMRSNGVRGLLQELFNYFSKLGYQLNIPEDVYPEYFNLAPKNAGVFHYTSFRRRQFTFSEDDFCISLIANPLIPEGRYLTKSELMTLDKWLSDNDSRWLVFDTVYDYNSRSLDFEFKSNNIVFVNSLSKINLTPGTSGWALCKTKLPGFEAIFALEFDRKLSLSIQNNYTKAWESIDKKLHLRQKFDWQPSKVGYLSILNEHFKVLLSEYNIAAIPASIFGITKGELSVISCLAEVKQNVL